ncbi:hypothetical protein ES703_17981 [subsurface metagenome]
MIRITEQQQLKYYRLIEEVTERTLSGEEINVLDALQKEFSELNQNRAIDVLILWSERDKK